MDKPYNRSRMSVRKKVEKRKLQRLICQSLRSLCEAGLPDSTNISIEGLIGITVNSEYVILVGVHEEIGDGEADMIECHGGEKHRGGGGGGGGGSRRGLPPHGSTQDSGKGHFFHDLHEKMMHQTHAAIFREQMMQAMHSGLGAHNLGNHGLSPPSSSNNTPSAEASTPDSKDKPLQAYSKGTPSMDKTGFDYLSFDGSDDEDLTPPSRRFGLPSTSSKNLASASSDGKKAFAFANYDRPLYEGNSRGEGGQQTETPTDNAEASGTKRTGGEKSLADHSEQQVQPSTICITPVVESPKPDDPAPPPTSSGKEDHPPRQPSGVLAADFGRRLGTLTAVKQEGASRRRFTKAQVHAGSGSGAGFHIEEISDSDNTMQDDSGSSGQVMSAVQDPMMAAGAGNISPNGRHGRSEGGSGGPGDQDGGSQPPSPEGSRGDVLGDGGGESVITDSDDIPMATDSMIELETLSQMDPDDQAHDMVELDNSLLQILPHMSLRVPEDSVMHEIVEIHDDEDDRSDMKGELRDIHNNVGGGGAAAAAAAAGENTGQSRQNDVQAAQERLRALMELQKKISEQINSENKTVLGSDNTAESTSATDGNRGSSGSGDNRAAVGSSTDNFDNFPSMPFPPFPLGRGFGRGGCFGRRGGMHRGRGGLFGRGGPMIGPFGHHHHHPFQSVSSPEKKVWKCKICAACFINKTNYEAHMVNHESKGQGEAGLVDGVGLPCPYCKKRFRYKSWLEQHITTHTKEKLFHCPYCSKAYTRRRNVRKHIHMFHPELLLGQSPKTEDSSLSLQQQEAQDS